MSTTITLIKRNIKLFFKDKGMFFTSLITPAILLVLYVTFLGNVYRNSFTPNLPESLQIYLHHFLFRIVLLMVLWADS